MVSKKWLVCTIAVSILANTVVAQENTRTPAKSTAARKIDGTSSGAGVRASKLIGMNIQNSQKESVGQIKDIVLDPTSMRIQYVAVTYGGFLGMGNKLFAVPMQAIKVTTDPDYRDNVVLVLDVTKEQMNGAQGFDEDHWPNFSDTNFTGDLYRRYKVEDRWNHSSNRDGKLDIDVDRNGVRIQVDEKNK